MDNREIVIMKSDFTLEGEAVESVQESEGEGGTGVLNGGWVPSDVEKLFGKRLIRTAAVCKIDSVIALRVKDEK